MQHEEMTCEEAAARVAKRAEGFTFTFTKKGRDKDGLYAFDVMVSHPRVRGPLATSYTCGDYHAVKWAEKQPRKFRDGFEPNGPAEHYKWRPSQRTLFVEEWLEDIAKVFEPEPARVLECLLNDAGLVELTHDFRTWWQDMGRDLFGDSEQDPAEILETFEQLRRIRSFLTVALGSELETAIGEAQQC